ncbi:MAG: hypothetical protein JWN60_280 [Acidobacteria bacterium]|jgi:hypothetical protein|nr:hypothetical protein [Acidobacteriota bacterium]
MINEYMFCPNCGKSEQKKDTFCRRCGMFLPDFDKIKKSQNTPEAHLKANAFLNLTTAIVSLGLAIALYSIFLGKENTPFIIYLTAGFLTAIFFWQVQAFVRTLLLKKHFKRNKNQNNQTETQTEFAAFEALKTSELLNEADFKDVVAASVVENTTKSLAEKIKPKSSQAEH